MPWDTDANVRARFESCSRKSAICASRGVRFTCTYSSRLLPSLQFDKSCLIAPLSEVVKAADAIRELADLLLMKGRQSAGYVLCISATTIAYHVSHAASHTHHTLPPILCPNLSSRLITRTLSSDQRLDGDLAVSRRPAQESSTKGERAEGEIALAFGEMSSTESPTLLWDSR